MRIVTDFNLTQLHMVNDPIYPMARIEEDLIYKDNNIKSLEKKMNNDDIEEIKATIESVMTDFIFAVCSESTLEAVTDRLAAEIEVSYEYDYELSVKFADDDLVVMVNVEDVENGVYTHFTGSTGSLPALDHKETKHEVSVSAYDRAMNGV